MRNLTLGHELAFTNGFCGVPQRLGEVLALQVWNVVDDLVGGHAIRDHADGGD